MVYIHPSSQGNIRGMCPALQLSWVGDLVKMLFKFDGREKHLAGRNLWLRLFNSKLPLYCFLSPKKNTRSEGCVLIPTAVTPNRTLPTPGEWIPRSAENIPPYGPALHEAVSSQHLCKPNCVLSYPWRSLVNPHGVLKAQARCLLQRYFSCKLAGPTQEQMTLKAQQRHATKGCIGLETIHNPI